MNLSVREELRLLIPIAKEMGLEKAALRLDAQTRPQFHQWDKRPEWYRFVKRFERMDPTRKEMIAEMRRWCREHALGHYSWRPDAPMFAFEEERDAVFFALAFEVEQRDWSRSLRGHKK